MKSFEVPDLAGMCIPSFAEALRGSVTWRYAHGGLFRNSFSLLKTEYLAA